MTQPRQALQRAKLTSAWRHDLRLSRAGNRLARRLNPLRGTDADGKLATRYGLRRVVADRPDPSGTHLGPPGPGGSERGPPGRKPTNSVAMEYAAHGFQRK